MATPKELATATALNVNDVTDGNEYVQSNHVNGTSMQSGNLGVVGEPSLLPEDTRIKNLRQEHMNEIIENQISKNQSLREKLEEIRQQRRQVQLALAVNLGNNKQGMEVHQKEKQRRQQQKSLSNSSINEESAPFNSSDSPTQVDTDDRETSTDSGFRECSGTAIDVAERLLDRLLRERQDALKSYQSILLKRKEIRKFLHLSQRWNVVNDCFHIWHQGPFGTINGLRLGLSEAAETNAMSSVISTGPSSASYSHVDGSSNNNENVPADSSATATASSQSQATPSRGSWLSSMSPFSSSTNTNSGESTTTATSTTNASLSSNNAETNQHNHGVGGIVSTQQLQQVPTRPSQPIKIPWLEINSALGHVALLLSCLASKNQSLPASRHTNLYFPYEVYPMGSSSKIGLLRSVELSTSSTSRYFPSMGSSSTTTPTPNSPNVTTELVTLHNLSYSDDSFSLFGKRNFNAALQCLLNIILKAAEQTIQRRDRTMALPHVIAPLNNAASNGATTSAASGSNAGELGIGGLSVSYGIADPIEWTRAMKFVLTDVKWLVAYSAKHVDR